MPADNTDSHGCRKAATPEGVSDRVSKAQKIYRNADKAAIDKARGY